MDFAEALAALALRVKTHRNVIHTEEATKNAFVMPFISTVLGYDVFNPLEVVPEYIADVGLRKGEKIDYAIMRDHEVQMLIECKKSTEALTIENASQLHRYFADTTARIAILTNGETYQLYTDLDDQNRMDAKPFLVLDLLDIDDTLIPEVRKLTKDVFDLDSIISAAGELKFIGQIKRELAIQFREPDDEWIRYFISRTYMRRITQRVQEQYAPLVTRATKQFLNDQVNERLKTALSGSNYSPADPALAGSVSSLAPAQGDIQEDTEFETTLEELEGYQIVKAIACSEVKPERITQRDSKSYFAVLLDDNNRKPIARLHFNSKSKKYLGLLDEEKNETRHELESLDEIYRYAEDIREAVRRYA